MSARWLKWIAGLAALGVLGFGVAASGVIPIRASSGHWALTEWFLHFSMARSVSTHSLGTRVPELDDPGLVLRGAAHYESGCRPCHGAPGAPPSRITRGLTPRPPSLTERVREWDVEELHYLVKHGVKMTGMPAWPSLERDDEVWAVVAFLLALPELEAGEYRRLAYGELAREAPLGTLPGAAAPPESAAESCARCHGLDGRGREAGAFPRLAGQHPEYLLASLRAYAEGGRHSGIMGPVASALGPAEMRELARWYGRRAAAATPREPETALRADPETLERGRRIALEGVPRSKVPACAQCHGPARTSRNPRYPILAGQHPAYLALQLGLFREGRRGGTEYGHLMREVARTLTSEQISDVALYYASLRE